MFYIPGLLTIKNFKNSGEVKMKQKLTLIIAFIALIVFITMPVSAYDNQLVRWNMSGTYGDGFGYARLYAYNVTAFESVKLVTYEALTQSCYNYNLSQPLEATKDVTYYINAQVYGNGTFHWKWNGSTWTTTGCELSWTLPVTPDRHGYTGTQIIYYTDPPQYVGFALFFGSTGMSTDKYAASKNKDNHYDHAAIGRWTSYGIQTVVPDASFSCTSNYPYLGTDLICTDTSTNTPTSWSWNFDRPDGTNSGVASTFNTLGFEVTQVGNYIVEMTATNSGGSDTISYIIHGRYSGNETVTNVTNVSALPTLPTGLPNPVNVNNLRNSILNHSAYGNMSWGYINTVDTFAEFINGSMSVIIGIFTTPIDWFTDAIGTIVTDMVTLTEPLIETASIFLQVVTRALIALPAVFVNIVTLGLIIDLIRLIIGGRQNT